MCQRDEEVRSSAGTSVATGWDADGEGIDAKKQLYRSEQDE